MELSFISSMVGWLHNYAGQPFYVFYNETIITLQGKPANFLLDQGHASNGAAGAAFIIIGLGGLLTLWLRQRQLRRAGSLHGFVRGLYGFWLAMTVICAAYSLACLIYVMVVTHVHAQQEIDMAVVAAEFSDHYPYDVPYPDLSWTPQNWYAAMLRLQLDLIPQRDDIRFHLNIMRAWEWNIIPMTLLGILVAVCAFVDQRTCRRSAKLGLEHGSSKDEMTSLET